MNGALAKFMSTLLMERENSVTPALSRTNLTLYNIRGKGCFKVTTLRIN